jgi:hypothetical protein
MKRVDIPLGQVKIGQNILISCEDGLVSRCVLHRRSKRYIHVRTPSGIYALPHRYYVAAFEPDPLLKMTFTGNPHFPHGGRSACGWKPRKWQEGHWTRSPVGRGSLGAACFLFRGTGLGCAGPGG